MRGAISKGGGNSSSAFREKKTEGWQGVGREAESERFEEKRRAVVNGNQTEDELVGQREGKVEPALWRRRHTRSPLVPRCLQTARCGRFMRDPRRTQRVLGW